MTRQKKSPDSGLIVTIPARLVVFRSGCCPCGTMRIALTMWGGLHCVQQTCGSFHILTTVCDFLVGNPACRLVVHLSRHSEGLTRRFQSVGLIPQCPAQCVQIEK